MIIILYLYFVFVCDILYATAEKRPCSNQSDCKDGADICSICIDDKDLKGQCVYVYPNAYMPSTCIKYKDNCPLNCSGNGECLTSSDKRSYNPYYYPYCRCKMAESYGESCQYVNPEKKPVFSYVKKQFDGMDNLACETRYMQFIFHSWDNASDLLKRSISIYIKVDDLSFRKFPIRLIKRETLLNTQYRGALIIKAVYPYKATENVYKLGDKFIGYTTKVHMNVFVDNRITFNNSWDIFVKYGFMKCLPTIFTNNCAMTPAEFHRSHGVEIDIDVNYIADGSSISTSILDKNCQVFEKMFWRIWKLNEGTAPYHPTFSNYTRSKRISFEPYSLENGIYEVQINVTNINSEKSLTNYAHCYFKVKCVPLVAKIVGGSDRMVSPNHGLMLRADTSFDPNMPSNNQSHVNIEWTCINILNPENYESICDPKQLPVSKYYYVPPKLLTPGAKYNFTVKVWTNLYNDIPDCSYTDMSPKFSSLIIKVAPLNGTELGDVAIECLKNCGQKVVPSNELILKAVLPLQAGVSSNTTYEWTYYANNGKEHSTVSIRVPGIRSHLLIIKEDALEPGSKYKIVATSGMDSTRYAKYSFETYSIDIDANCSVTPEYGVKGFTAFEIQCYVFKNPSMTSLSFEFYDKTLEEKAEPFIFNGRMLGTSKDGQLMEVRLTRGHLLIYILSDYGLFLSKYIKVELDDWKINGTILCELYGNVTNSLQFGSLPNTLGALSFIPDIIPNDMDKNKSEIMETLIEFISQMNTLNDLADMKLIAATLANVLLTMNKPNQLHLKTYYLMATFRTIKQVAGIFAQKIRYGNNHNMSPRELKQLAVSLLNCIHVGLLCREKQTENIQEGVFDISTERELNLASSHVESTIDLITNALSFMQVPGQPVTKLSSKSEKIVVWVMESDEIYTIPQLISEEGGIPVEFPYQSYDQVLKRLNKNENIAFQVVSIADNIFWWSHSAVHSTLISVSIKRQSNTNHLFPIRYVDHPLRIVINTDGNINSTKIQDFTITDMNVDPVSMNFAIRVHRFDPAVRSLMVIKFLFPPTNGSLRVLVMDQFRPDYKIMLEEGRTIAQHSSVYYVPYYDYDEPYFLYMGVMPETNINHSISYTFEVTTTVCYIWANGQWTSAGCHIWGVESGNRVHCECTHFSIFSVAMPVPPNSVDPYADIKLFITVAENPYIVVFVIIVLLIYLLLCLYLWKLERRDKEKSVVIILDDNFSFDKVPYLVAVCTGPRLNAGTSAHVGIKLIGTTTVSHVHILSCKSRPILQTNTDDWFLLYCSQPLGDIEGVHIWHDNSGSSPEWLCDKIFVYDLFEQTETLFVINEWLAFNDHEYPEVYVLSAAIDDIINVKTLFLNNLFLAFRESHMLLGCIVCHPRSEMPRIHRISIFVCSLLVAMLCSLMFYLPADEELYIDNYQYDLNTVDLYVGLESLIISYSVCFFIFYLFKKSYKITYTKHINCLRVRNQDSNGEPGIYTFENKQREGTGGTLYRTFLKGVNHILKSNPMEPVRLPHVKPILKVRRFWLVCSWTVCLTFIILSSYLVMLYGLKLSMVRSKIWLSTFLLAMGAEAVLLGPMRIVFMSTIIALALQKMFDLDVHDIGVKDLTLFQFPSDPEFNNKVIRQRSNPMYKPLPKCERGKILANEKLKKKRLLFYDFLISILLIVVLNNMIFKLWIKNFYANFHIVKLMTHTKYESPDDVDFFNVRNVSSFERYIQNTFVDRLYHLRWYNGRSLNSHRITERSEYWASDYTNRMIGLPVIRQLRVIPELCDSPFFFKGYCIPRWRSATEDTDDYGEMWKPATWSDTFRNNSPWRYTKIALEYILTQYRLYSPSGETYTPGGYMTMLGPTRIDAEQKMAELQENTWVDLRTRVVFVDFSVYNVNENIFIQVTLMVEYLSTGIALPKSEAMYFKMDTHLSAWYVLLVPLIFYYPFRCVQTINRHGFTHFFSHFTNLCQLGIAYLGFMVLFRLPNHSYVSSRYSELFHRKGLDNYFNFDSLANNYVLLRHDLSLILCIAFLHGIALLKTGRKLSKIFHTFFLSLNFSFWLTISIAVIIVSLVFITTCANILELYDVTYIIINMKSLSDLQLNRLQCLQVQLFVVTKCLSIAICFWCFVVHFICCNRVSNL